ncbi:MAG: hypothetical protein IAF94_19535 [Pirellulaceae bacterium]|nr:hypothetical protein [Pirellulaceae bacterium]
MSSSNSSILCLEPLNYHHLLTTKLTTWSYSRLPAALTTEYLPGTSSGGSGSSGGSYGGMSGGGPGAGTVGMPAMGSGMGMPGAGMPPPMSGSGMMPGSGIIPPGPNPNPRFVDQNIYTQVAHALWTIIIAALGGALACWFYKTRQRPASERMH